MKATRYSIAIFALITGLLFACKKETTATEEIGVENYDTNVSDTISISNEAITDSVAGSGMSTGNNGKNGHGSGSGNIKNQSGNGSGGTSDKTGRNAKDDADDMTKDTIMTPAGKYGPSGTTGSGRGNSRAKTVGT